MKFTFAKVASRALPLVKIQSGENSHLVKENGRDFLIIATKIREKESRRKLIILVRTIVQKAKEFGLKKIAIEIGEIERLASEADRKDLAEIVATQLVLANYEFNKFKSKKDSKNIDQVEIIGLNKSETLALFNKGVVIGERINLCRTLANTPGGDMTPTILAKEAKNSVAGLSVSCKTLGKRELERIGMRGVLGVARGSVEDPKFIILEYVGSKKTKPIVFVGKGVTFDTGGINLKPGEYIGDMHMDMSGGAAVISAIGAIAELKLKVHVIGLIPAVENMPSGSSYRPGDVIKTLSGQTVEIANTDAEGRMILADALTYAEKYSPALVVDVATLTGASAVALGERASAIFTADSTWSAKFEQWGEESGDYVWPLPLWEEYEEEIKGNIADWSNLGKTRYGGAITAATFLHQFAKKYPWVHLDIAPRMTSITGDMLARGAIGAGTGLLIKVANFFSLKI